MKRIVLTVLLLALSACVADSAATPPPDAGTDDFLDPKGRGCSGFQCLVAPDAGVEEGRKGGETSHCEGCR